MRSIPSRRRVKWWWLAGAVVALLILVPAMALVALDWRLRQGPLAANFLIGRIEAAINDRVAPFRVRIGSAQVRYDADNGDTPALLISRVQVSDGSGAELAQIPRASIDLDWGSLQSGAIVASGLTLLQPQVRVRYEAGHGLVVKAEAPEPEADQVPPDPSLPREPANTSGGAAPADGAKPAFEELLSAMRAMVARASLPGSSASPLTALHIRDATMTVGQIATSSIWSVPKFDLRTEQKAPGELVVAGSGQIVAPGGPAIVNVTLEQPRAGADLLVSATVDHLVPADLANLSPALLPLAPALLPVGGQVTLDLAPDGTLAKLDMKVGLGKGQLDVGGACADSFRLDQGEIEVKYIRGTGRVELLPSKLASNGSSATVSGLALVNKDSQGRDRWQYNIELSDVMLADPASKLPPLPVDSWNARGTFTPSTGEAVLDRMALQVGDARLAMAGKIAATGLNAEARVESADPGLMLRLWPACFQAYSRNWVLANVQSGRISKGHMLIALDADALQRLRSTGKAPDDAASAEISVDDIAFTYADGMPPVISTHGALQFAGRRFTASIPEAASQLASGHVITMTNASYEVADILDPSPRGRIQLDVTGPIETGLEFLNSKPLALLASTNPRVLDLTGEFSGKLDLELPVTRAAQAGDIALKGSATLRSLKLKRPVGGFSLQGGTVDLEASESVLRADGDLLVNGVPAKLLWSRPLGSGHGPVPPMRIVATLDASDREQLGIYVNHLVAGDVPVTVDLASGSDATGGRLAHIEADLTGAELVFDTLAWRKPQGEPATLSFDAAAAERGRSRLDNFRLVGDKVAVSGTVELGADNKVAAFHFPNLSINVITQLDVTGKVRPDKVLEVSAKGRFFDGRDFFSSLFSIGQITARRLPPPKATAGLDLTADIDSVLGYSQVTLHAVHVHAVRQQGLLTALKATGTLDGGKMVAAALEHQAGQPRYLTATTDDAGRAFGLIGLYQGIEGGSAGFKVNLDGEGGADRTGTLSAKRFAVLGDPVVDEVLSEAAKPGSPQPGHSERPSLDFDRLQVAFSVGQGQLNLLQMLIHGPILGASMHGQIDYGRQTVQLGGTYIPLYGLNSAFGALPLFGPILVGRAGEGLLGITFAIDGSLNKPEVVVNPVSAVAPGIFRQIFEIGPDTWGQPSSDAGDRAPIQADGKPADIGQALPPMSEDDAVVLPPSDPPAH